MSKAMDLTGKRFGKLVCLSMLNERTKNGHVQWAKELGIGYKALHGRISRGQKIGEIIAITGKPTYIAAERSHL